GRPARVAPLVPGGVARSRGRPQGGHVAPLGPPRLAERLVGRSVPPGREGDTIRGDLLEELQARARRGSRWAAKEWYWREACSLALRYRGGRRPPVRTTGERPSIGEALSHDVRYALRTLRKAPGFTAIVLVTLALGIGANTAIFSAGNAVLLRPLPYRESDRLVRLVAYNPLLGITSSNVSAADVADWRRGVRGFDGLAAFAIFSFTLGGGDGAERVQA